MKKGLIILAVFIAAAAFFSGYMLYQKSLSEKSSSNNGIQVVEKENSGSLGEAAEILSEESSEHTIEITSSGFSPKILEIKAGDSVAWINKKSSSSWPASAVHPTHSVYPEKGGCIGSKFDACRALEGEESWSFIFNEIGEWEYHDHLNPGDFGTIIVS